MALISPQKSAPVSVQKSESSVLWLDEDASVAEPEAANFGGDKISPHLARHHVESVYESVRRPHADFRFVDLHTRHRICRLSDH